MKIEIKNITKKFKNFSLDLDFSVYEGETLVIAGPSGCGKTSILHIIAGLLEQDSGNIILNNKVIDNIPSWERNIGIVFQDLALFPHLNVEKNISYSLFIKHIPQKKRIEKVKEILEIVHLQGYEKRKIETLSGGEKQRVAIARALASDPCVLLFDEPFSGLDIMLRRILQKEFLGLRQIYKAPWIFVTHSPEDAIVLGSEQNGNRVALINGGRIVEIGSAEELKKNPKTDFCKSFFS
ncbi:MAG: ABC transporter ATP-binding protein [Spirochaetaceae bacterium]|jgi:ABC-type Fe3+/spermidine/putrescine transport system ATPase subunit|nr:ABC transporter ATP-binding protein [Spirochaetaceae bacterium]